jgi:uncharacterized protein
VDAAAPHQPDTLLLGFAAALRAGGVAVTTDRGQSFLRAVALARAPDRSWVYWCGRATLCAGSDDGARYDEVFDAWFGGDWLPNGRATPATTVTVRQPALEESQDGGPGAEAIGVRALASDRERLRHRDVASLGPAEKRRMDLLLDSLRVRPPQRSSPRLRPARRGQIDARATLRDHLRHAGEPTELRHRRRTVRRRRTVLLVDVSGSMQPYADHLLRLAHRLVRAAPTSTEVLTMGTRLTRVTAALRLRDSTAALDAAGSVVPDWSGGTRLGEVLQAFLDRHGQRGMARGAVVVVFSDGWERGDPALLAEQALRLSRLAARLIWVNPHRGKPGYLPVQSGIVAVTPAIDDLVAGHSLAAFEELVEVIGRA